MFTLSTVPLFLASFLITPMFMMGLGWQTARNATKKRSKRAGDLMVFAVITAGTTFSLELTLNELMTNFPNLDQDYLMYTLIGIPLFFFVIGAVIGCFQPEGHQKEQPHK